MSGRNISLPFETVALVAATPKTVAAWKSAANQGSIARLLDLSFDGTDSTKGPVLVELCTWDLTTAGTPGSSPLCTNTDPRISGTVQTQGYLNFSAEPTNLTVVKAFLVPQYGGSLIGYVINGLDGYKIAGGKGFALRLTAPFACGATGTISGCE